jgi:hypothetical protein
VPHPPDPIDAFVPELAERRILRTIESELDDTVPVNRRSRFKTSSVSASASAP